MDAFALLSLMIVTAAVLSWVNVRFVRLPTTVGVMVIALGMSLGLQAGDALGLGLREPVQAFVTELDLGHSLLDVMLAFLLFAGALHVDLDELLGQKWVVSLLATVGVVATTLLVAVVFRALCSLMGVEIDLLHALLFGALIAPTDPIAVLSILKTTNAPASLATKITGESLFNDGIGVVLFTILLGLALPGTGSEPLDAGGIALLFLEEVPGSLLLGWLAGWLAYRMLRAVDDRLVETLVTLALCMGLYSLASALHGSGPLAVVVAGLFIGNTGRAYAMSDTTRHNLDTFWELVDEILNVVLFVLLGMEVLLLDFPGVHVALGLAAIPLVLLARLASVSAAVSLLRRRRRFSPHVVTILTWGGLRGAISVALALSLPGSLPSRDLILTVTYVVVVFSIVVQGLSMGPLLRRLLGTAPDAPGASHGA